MKVGPRYPIFAGWGTQFIGGVRVYICNELSRPASSPHVISRSIASIFNLAGSRWFCVALFQCSFFSIGEIAAVGYLGAVILLFFETATPPSGIGVKIYFVFVFPRNFGQKCISVWIEKRGHTLLYDRHIFTTIHSHIIFPEFWKNMVWDKN